jgi:hypothetical protein
MKLKNLKFNNFYILFFIGSFPQFKTCQTLNMNISSNLYLNIDSPYYKRLTYSTSLSQLVETLY